MTIKLHAIIPAVVLGAFERKPDRLGLPMMTREAFICCAKFVLKIFKTHLCPSNPSNQWNARKHLFSQLKRGNQLIHRAFQKLSWPVS